MAPCSSRTAFLKSSATSAPSRSIRTAGRLPACTVLSWGTTAVPGNLFDAAPGGPTGEMLEKVACVGDAVSPLALKARRTLLRSFLMPEPDMALPRARSLNMRRLGGWKTVVCLWAMPPQSCAETSTKAWPGGRMLPRTRLPADGKGVGKSTSLGRGRSEQCSRNESLTLLLRLCECAGRTRLPTRARGVVAIAPVCGCIVAVEGTG